MKQILIIVLALSMLTCQEKKARLTFYVENISRVDTVVHFNILVDEEMVVNQDLVYSTLRPNYDTFVSEQILKDSIRVRAITNTGADIRFKIEFKKNTYIFLSYTHDSIMTMKEQIVIEKMKQNGFDPSIFLEKKAIKQRVQYTKPMLH